MQCDSCKKTVAAYAQVHYGGYDKIYCQHCAHKASKDGHCYLCRNMPKRMGRGVNKIEGNVAHIYYSCENCHVVLGSMINKPSIDCHVCHNLCKKPLKMLLCHSCTPKNYCSIECAKKDSQIHKTKCK